MTFTFVTEEMWCRDCQEACPHQVSLVRVHTILIDNQNLQYVQYGHTCKACGFYQEDAVSAKDYNFLVLAAAEKPKRLLPAHSGEDW